MLDEILKVNGVTHKQYPTTFKARGRFFRRLLIIQYWREKRVINLERAFAMQTAEIYANYERERAANA